MTLAMEYTDLSMDLKNADPEVARALSDELVRQQIRSNLLRPKISFQKLFSRRLGLF